MEQAEENRVREDLERQHGRVTAVRSKGRAAFFFRPATFDEWREFKMVDADQLLVSETLTVACCVWSAEGYDIKAAARENGNFGVVVARKIGLISGGEHSVKADTEKGTAELLDHEDNPVLTFHKPPFEEIQRYTGTINKSRFRIDAMLTYAVAAADGDSEEARTKLKSAPASIAAVVDAIESLGAGDFDFEGN